MGKNPFKEQIIAGLFDQTDWEEDQISRINFIENCAKQFGQDGILDIGCGTGIITEILKKLEYKVIGIDNSIQMLNLAKRKSNACIYVNADMTSFSFNINFSLITVTGSVFCYLLRQSDQLKFFQNVNRHLSTGSVLIIESYNFNKKLYIDCLSKGYTKKIVKVNDIDRNFDITVIQKFDFNKQIWSGFKKFTINKQEIKINFTKRYTSKYELKLLLEISGFKISKLFHGYNSKKKSDNLLIWKCVKIRDV